MRRANKSRGTTSSLASGTIVPDYRMPAAIMVPHYYSEITPVLEEIAIRVSRYCGVILLSSDKDFTQSFIAARKNQSRFTCITAPFDTPWIRDRSPVAISTSKGIRWTIPRVPMADRPKDNRLFTRVCAVPYDISPFAFLPQGNIVTGPRGLVMVSKEVLLDNQLDMADLDSYAESLGVKRWLVFSNFKNEQTGHADIHVRVLKPKLFAVAWNLSVKQDRAKAEQLIKKIKEYDRGIQVLKIPIRSRGAQYASLVNWIQIGRRLLLPRYDLTKAADIEGSRKILHRHGFTPEFIYSPTLQYSGSLHCLTASIFV
jgi:agmatine/peptidylarginine deiminase